MPVCEQKRWWWGLQQLSGSKETQAEVLQLSGPETRCAADAGRLPALAWQEDQDGALLPLIALVDMGHQRLQQLKVQPVLVKDRQVTHHAGAARGSGVTRSKTGGSPAIAMTGIIT